MIDKEQFFIEKTVVDWLMENGLDFAQAMEVISYSENSDVSLAVAYVELLGKGKND